MQARAKKGTATEVDYLYSTKLYELSESYEMANQNNW